MSWVALMAADVFIHFAKEISQRTANLYVDGALSLANMAEVVFALEKLSLDGL